MVIIINFKLRLYPCLHLFHCRIFIYHCTQLFCFIFHIWDNYNCTCCLLDCCSRSLACCCMLWLYEM